MSNDFSNLMQQVAQAQEQLKAMQNQTSQMVQRPQDWTSMLSSGNNYAQQQLQQQQLIQQQQQNLARLEPIHMQFIQVYSNTKEGAPLADEWKSRFEQWMAKHGHKSRLEQEASKHQVRMEQEFSRLRAQFEKEDTVASGIREKLGVGSIEYAHQLAVAISEQNKKSDAKDVVDVSEVQG